MEACATLLKRQVGKIPDLGLPPVRASISGNTEPDNDAAGAVLVVAGYRNTRDDGIRPILTNDFDGRDILEERIKAVLQRLGDELRLAPQRGRKLRSIDSGAPFPELVVERHGRVRFRVSQLVDTL
jgi:hypothetical protein